MNCPWCANEIPDGSEFCNHCGTSTQPREKKRTTPAIVLWGGVAVIVCGLLYLGLGSWRANRVRAAVFHTPITFTNETQNLGAHSWRYIPVLLPYSGSLDVTLQVARGNPLDVYLVDAGVLDVMKQTANWRAIQGNANFSAVKTTTYHRTAPLNQGAYYLVMRDTSLGILSASGTDVDLKIELVP
jgi:predicted nucleic acid-binding Zn ribbon protein